ncbi:MAG: prealbumin-like fold domain-containing protein [Lachnospiraceae bacterium]|nr:prealbumin-like fold domain-containing protein [Lachnospiraceae bacterium]
MKNINWSKLIAVVLSVFIVTQFVEVSFLAARRFGGSSSSDATEANGVAGLYEGLLTAVGEDNGLIMSSRAAGEGAVTARVGEGNVWSLGTIAPGNLTDLSVSITFSLAEGETIPAGESFEFSLPTDFVTSEATITSGLLGNVSVSGTSATVSFDSGWTEGDCTVSINGLDYVGELEAKQTAEDTTLSAVTWTIVSGSEATILLPKTDYVEPPTDLEPPTDPSSGNDPNSTSPATTQETTSTTTPATTPATTTTITVAVQDNAETPAALGSAGFLLKRSDTADGEFADYATIPVTSTAGATQAVADGYYQLTQNASPVADGYTAFTGTISFSVADGVITASNGDGWTFDEGTFTVTNPAEAVISQQPVRLGANRSNNATTAVSLTGTTKKVSGSYTTSVLSGNTISGVAANDLLKMDFSVVLSGYGTGTSLATARTITITLPETWTYTGTAVTNEPIIASDNTVNTDPLVTYSIANGGSTITVVRRALSDGETINPPLSGVFSVSDIQVGATVAGNMTWTDDTSATAHTVTATAAASSNASIRITRNTAVPYVSGGTVQVMETPLTGTGSTSIVASFDVYTKSGTQYTKITTATASTDPATGIATITGLTSGTDYYIKETTSLTYTDARYDGKADYAYERDSSTAVVRENDYWKITASAGTKEIVLNDNPAYAIKLVNGSAAPIAGQSMRLAGAAGAFYQKRSTTTDPAITFNEAGTQADWTTTSSVAGAVFNGELIAGKTYTLTVPSADGASTENYTLSVDVTTGTVTQTGGTAADFAYSNGVVTIRRAITTGSMDFQLTDATSGSAITTGGAAFKLYTNSGCTSDSGITVTVTNSTGHVTATIPAGTYYLKQDANKAPTGYEDISTAQQIDVSGAGVITYPSTAVWDTTGTTKKLKYTRIKPTLTISRTGGSGVAYGVFTETGTTPVETLTLNSSGTYTVSESTNLQWNTPYYIEDTAATTVVGRDEASHGPIVFKPDMASGTLSSGSTYTATPGTMTIAVNIVPGVEARPTFTLKRIKASSTTETEAVSGATVDVTGVFAGNATSQTLTFTTGTDGTPTAIPTGFLVGQTYTVTERTASATGYTRVIFKLTLTSATTVRLDPPDGSTSISGQATASGLAITMTETIVTSSVKIRMEVCTYERGEKFEDHVDRSAEIKTAPSGFAFKVYTNSDASTEYKGPDNKTLGTLATDSSGDVEIKNLPDGTYYLKYSGTVSDSDAKKATAVEADTKSIFKIVISNGQLTSDKVTKANDSGTWRAKDGKIQAFLKQGSIKLTASSDKNYYIYRLYSGSDKETNDKRSDAKMKGETKSFSDDKSKFIKIAGLGDLFFDALEYLDGLFTLKALAAEDAKTIEYPNDSGTTWELIGSVKPGKGSTSDLEGLIAGQAYLIREGDSESKSDSDRYYLATATTSGKSLATVAASNSSASTATTANKANTNTGTGTGSASGSGKGSNAGGARGSATGDAGDLWLHLIIMLIAFDALAADLLYISRKKQVVRRR